jgi:hypothetical protein
MRASSGTWYACRGRYYARISLGSSRRSIALPTWTSDTNAATQSAILAELAGKLRAAGKVDLAPRILDRAAKDLTARALADVRELVNAVCTGRLVAAGSANGTANGTRLDEFTTFETLGKCWTSGDLAKLFPDHIKAKGTSYDDDKRLERHVYPHVKGIPLSAFQLDHAELVMRRLPPRSQATRRHVAQLMHRVLAMAVFPLRILTSNPLPRGWLPKPGDEKAKQYLYPSEDAALLRCREVPLCYRILYGYLDRGGYANKRGVRPSVERHRSRARSEHTRREQDE